MMKMTNGQEDFAGIDFDFNTLMYVPDQDKSDDLTRAMMEYLRNAGMKVYKATNPIVMYEGNQYQMISRQLSTDKLMLESFEEVFDKLMEDDPRVVLFYEFLNNYSYSPDMDLSFEPSGDHVFRERRVIRYALVPNGD